MFNQVLKKITNYKFNKDIGDSTPYEVTIHAVPLNKKGFCKPSIFMTTKEGEKEIFRCKNYYKKEHCSDCIKLAKELIRRDNV